MILEDFSYSFLYEEGLFRNLEKGVYMPQYHSFLSREKIQVSQNKGKALSRFLKPGYDVNVYISYPGYSKILLKTRILRRMYSMMP